jgi:quercetin dioxygenase-like cupin family protein
MNFRHIIAAVALGPCALAFCKPVCAQDPVVVQVCKPVNTRTVELGCWILADQPIGPLTKAQVFWHLDTYPTQAAAEMAKGPSGTVVKALSRVWLLTIEESTWHAPSGGEHITTIGPLPNADADRYSAQYMEAIFTPGMTAATHVHPGPEAFYTVSGETSLETSEGVTTGRPGGPPVIVAGGLPMELVATGTETRRSIVLILHDSTKPSGHLIHDWTPKGLCKR